MKLVISTRGSKLSLKQADLFENYIKNFLNVNIEKKIVKTKGDLILDKPLYEIGEKGLFEKEVNNAVLNGEADLAIHSMKDLPKDIDPRLDIIMVLPREIPNDSLVFSKYKVNDIMEIKENSIVGTSSIRRKSFLMHYNDKVIIKPLRGNIDTRIKKLENNEYDFIILAEAGIRRLNFNINRLLIPLELFPPEPGQGIIAVVGIKDNSIVKEISKYTDKNTYYMAVAEREFLNEAKANCNTPIGAVSIINQNKIMMIVGLASYDGSFMDIIRFKDELNNAKKLGKKAGQYVYSMLDKVLK
ncbi:porphobilinogen deaminase [Caldisphaera lagunensis DSM 15908]|uniref:Hydroxymethylbilane synthase n=1 Tax=Caldisphaera lagunensis (strain DSM 15908 / JCM 11604 / ANMR 0165 / IC-154) TaxID=1056495 RepID=L0AAG9_CALLD|nr:hydroxymethylbilane synthase [Caldisphaera lagunensis]AFZ70876.1 porphobilinogen deaminase [Caldisphaera lagunensis DSM 15908]